MPRTGESVFKRKDGRWEARYISSHDTTGRAMYKSVYAKTYNEVRKKRTEIQKAVKTVEPHPQGFAKLLDDWLKQKQIVVKPSTYIKYRNMIDGKILPAFGNIETAQVTPKLLEAFCHELLTRGLSANTVRSVAAILRNVLEYAQQNDIIGEFPFVQLRLPKTENKVVVLSVESQCILTEHLMRLSSSSNCGILLSLYLGLRIGELCALRCSDISIKDGLLSVNGTLQRLQCVIPSGSKTQIIVTSPKSVCSIRKIPIPAFLLPMVSCYLQSGDAYFLSGSHIPVEPRVMENRLKFVLKQCDIEPANFHALRHTFATRCVERGFDIKALSEILGHSSVKITLDRYVHPSQEQKKKCMDSLSDLLHLSSK